MPSVSVALDQFCFDQNDASKLYQQVEENIILKERVDILKEKVSNLEERLKIKDEMIALETKRADIYKNAFEMEKDLTDRALKLSEKSSTGKTMWQILGTLGVVAIIITVIASVL